MSSQFQDAFKAFIEKYNRNVRFIITTNHIYERTYGNPEHSFAFKMITDNQIAEAVVLDVLWTPSKNGYLKPRIQIKPVLIDNVSIQYLNGFNAYYIEQNKISINNDITFKNLCNYYSQKSCILCIKVMKKYSHHELFHRLI